MPQSTWTPDILFSKNSYVAIDCETDVVDMNRCVNNLVIATIHTNDTTYLLYREQLEIFINHALEHNYYLIGHNIQFDLAVFNKYLKGQHSTLDIYELVERDQVWDTGLLFILYRIATIGHYEKWSLDYVAEQLLNKTLNKAPNYQGKNVRKTFGDYINDPHELPQPYLDYACEDAAVTYQVFFELTKLCHEFLNERLKEQDTFGLLSPEEFNEAIQKYGLFTHHIQLKSSIVLAEITRNGMNIDQNRLAILRANAQAHINHTNKELASKYNFYHGHGSSKALQENMRLTEKAMGIRLPRTATGSYETKKQTFIDYGLMDYSPFFKLYTDSKFFSKEIKTYLDKMAGNYGLYGDSEVVVHPSFKTIIATGRTASYDEINSQNIPRGIEGFRECFIPKSGHVFVNIDFSAVELVTLCESLYKQFKIPNCVMKQFIDEGKDVHKETASLLYNKPVSDVTKDQRQAAKALNFSAPTGSGVDNLITTASKYYGVTFTKDEATNILTSWKNTYPEMHAFLHEVDDSGYLRLTRAVNYKPFDDASKSDRELGDIYGRILVKIMSNSVPTKFTGEPYSERTVDYAWSTLWDWAITCPWLSGEYKTWIASRQASAMYADRLLEQFKTQYQVTWTGRFRKTSTYTEHRNSCFQATAADGAKLAMWELWRAGYTIVNFIHDEFLIEVPEHVDNDYTHVYDSVIRLVIRGMRKVVTETRVSAEGYVGNTWSKKGELVMDANGKVGMWNYASS